jgi:formylglycine-generating enzyme required for sulfatase activity
MRIYINLIIGVIVLFSIINVAIAENTGDLQITCKPGIRIYLDNTFTGATNSEEDGLYLKNIEAGQHEIRAEKEGFVTKTFVVTIEAGKAVELKIGELIPKPTIRQEDKEDKTEIQVGKIIITSIPIKCKVWFLDDVIEKEKDQVIIENIPVGEYMISFSRDNDFLETKLNIKVDVILNVKANFRQKEVIVEEMEPEPVVNKSVEVKTEKIGKDGAPMMLISAGEFQMGSDEGGNDEKLVHTVYLDDFYMDKYEVTNAQYKKFMDASGYKSPKNWDDPRFNAPNQPVIGVSWNDAKAYADWAGKRLPTEAEWEKAARGGLVGKKYPLGDNLTHDEANYAKTGGKDTWENTAPVGSFAPNGYGLYDMAGNVWEWCEDWYSTAYYYYSPKSNPKGTDSGSVRVFRGGSWSDDPDELRVSYRSNSGPDGMFGDVGFRCVER